MVKVEEHIFPNVCYLNPLGFNPIPLEYVLFACCLHPCLHTPPAMGGQQEPWVKQPEGSIQQGRSIPPLAEPEPQGAWHHHSDWNRERTCIGRMHWQCRMMVIKPSEAFPQPPEDCLTWPWRRESCCVGHQCCSNQGSVIDCCFLRALNHPVSDVSESQPVSTTLMPQSRPTQRKYLGGKLECSAQAVSLLTMRLTRVP